MKKIYGTLAMIVVITIHFIARFMMEDAYTFSAASFNQSHSGLNAAGFSGSTVQIDNNNAQFGAGTFTRNTFSMVLNDPFADQWNP